MTALALYSTPHSTHRLPPLLLPPPSHHHLNPLGPSPAAAQGLARLEELVRKLVDLVDNRVEANLAAIAATPLVELPSDRSFSVDEFATVQVRRWVLAARGKGQQQLGGS